MIAAFPGAAVSEVADDWDQRWRQFHRPVEIGPLWVGPPWQSPPAGRIAVVIDPGRAFGTGAHATTRLCLELLLAERRGGVVDLGCGSGVVAVAAAALGFAPVLALDLDPVAVEVARVNARANGVEVAVEEADVCTVELPVAGLAIANIARDVVCGLAGRLRSPRLIASGYRSEDRADISGFASQERRVLDGWAAELFVAR